MTTTTSDEGKRKWRIVKILALNDPHVLDLEDDGLITSKDLNGGSNLVPRRRRAQIMAMLTMSTFVDGKRMALFRVTETSSSFHPDDPIAALICDRESGKLLKPNAEWLAERKKRCDALEARQTAMKTMLDDGRAREVLRGLAPLLGLDKAAAK